MKDPKLYLQHISECIRRILDYTKEGKEHFLSDLKTQDAVLRNLQTLAESTQNLPENMRSPYPEIDWRGISGFRNVLVHDYLEIDLELVWTIIQSELPSVEKVVAQINESLS